MFEMAASPPSSPSSTAVVEINNSNGTKKNKRSPKLCTIQCEWENCNSTVTLTPSEYSTFSDHLKIHADEFVSRIHNEAGEGNAVSCCCMWRECSWEGCEYNELIRHIMFHGYHTLLRSLGSLVQSKLNLNSCALEVDDQYHMFPCVTTPYACHWKDCEEEEFYCPDKFYRHVEKHVFENVAVYNDENQLKTKCSWGDCSNQFRDKHKLKEHTRVHTHEKMFACPGCGGLFSNRTKLLDHLSRQNAAAYENYQCSHCLKRCASERLLRDHMRHHVNYLKCPHCDMTCPNPGSLKYHIHYRHSDDRPYPCNMCEQKFKSNSDLIRHEESHLQKSYVCTEENCNYATKTAHCLRRHIKITHSGTALKRYVCHICSRAYSRGFGLTKHLKKQHDFQWPSGHPRFRYIEYDDGLFRLQMVRFESAELTKRLLRDTPDIHLDGYEEEEVVETQDIAAESTIPPEGDNDIRPDNDGDNNVKNDGDNNLQNDGDNITEDNGDNAGVFKENVEVRKEIVISTTSQPPESSIVSTENLTNNGITTSTTSSTTTTPLIPTASATTTNDSSSLVLQPKPPGYDSTIMKKGTIPKDVDVKIQAQLMALAAKPSSGVATNPALIDEIYKSLLKKINENKQNETSEAADNIKIEYVDQSDIMFQQVAISDNQGVTTESESNANQMITTHVQGVNLPETETSGGDLPNAYLFSIEEASGVADDVIIEQVEAPSAILDLLQKSLGGSSGGECEQGTTASSTNKRKFVEMIEDEEQIETVLKQLKTAVGGEQPETGNEAETETETVTTTTTTGFQKVDEELDASQVLLSLTGT